MKKIISLVLVLVMICAMATTAFAEEVIITTSDTGSTAAGADYTWNISIDAVLGKDAVTEAEVAANYYVVVEWTVDSSLTYTIGKEAYSWNVYSDVANKTDATAGNAVGAGYEVDYSLGEWTGEANVNVKITNWSNRSLTATVEFAAAEENTENGVVQAVTFKEAIEKQTLEISAASAGVEVIDGALADGAEQVEATVTVNGANIDEGAINKETATIGTVTITLVGLETATDEVTP